VANSSGDAAGVDAEALLSRNALLAANGEPSRELQAWLEDAPYDDVLPEASAVSRGSCSGAPPLDRSRGRQPPRGRRRAERRSAQLHGLRICDSLELHACHGALRQCEALRDELLRRFAADPTLEPRHVLVMTPGRGDLRAARRRGVRTRPGRARHSAARRRSRHPRDQSRRRGALRVLALGAERVTASGIAELLSLGPLRARFELDDADLGDLTWMIDASGMRWAWDAEDRASHEQPRVEQNTLRFGLERLALGVLMPDEGGLDVAGSPGDPARGPIVPLELATRERVERFGRFAELCRVVELEVRALREPGTIEDWQRRLSQALDALTLVSGSSAWQRVQVAQVLEELLAARRRPEAYASSEGRSRPCCAAPSSCPSEATAPPPAR
jgi:exodeoxyribonuclease V gamma subunit